MWDRPDDLIGRADVDKIIQEPPHKKGLEDMKKLSKFSLGIHPLNLTLFYSWVESIKESF